jgi:hypothetical protein
MFQSLMMMTYGYRAAGFTPAADRRIMPEVFLICELLV